MKSDVAFDPVPKKFLTPGVWVLILGAAMTVSIALYRFFFGLQATTNLDDQYPWGIWIAIDVATGVALAAGGFTTAALAYIFHHHRFEPVVRAALLTALLGYTFVALGLLVDLGRYYNIWHPILPSMWQGNSALFEVGMCVMFYLTVLYIEFMPIVTERFKGKVNLPGGLGRLNGLVERVMDVFDRSVGRVMFLFVIAGVVLSCMHQSSLGSLILIAPSKVHPLWYTPILPLLFLLSAIAVGLPMVIFESMLASRIFKRKPEMELLGPLGRIAAMILGVYLIAKVSDLLIREAHVHLFTGDFKAKLFLLEVGLGVIAPILLLLSNRVRRNPALLFMSATMIVLGVVLNRINVFIVAYSPPYADYSYFPSLMEILFTTGMIMTLMLVYRAAVTILPILPKEEEHGAEAENEAKPGRVKTLAAGAAVLLIGLGLAVGSAEAYSDAPGTRVDCASCHSCKNPTKEAPCLLDCPRPMKAEGAIESATEIPDYVIMGELSEIYVPVVFPHKLHADMERMGQGCAVCHHYNPPGPILKCKECHGLPSQPEHLGQPSLKGAYHRQCLGCHREWSHETDCNVCHARLGANGLEELPRDLTDIIGSAHPKIETPDKWVYRIEDMEEGGVVTFHHSEHVDMFGLDCVSCHKQESCGRCHDEAAKTPHVRADPHEDCMACHNVEEECERCHKNDEAPGFDHGLRTGFVLKDYHKRLACNACHRTPQVFTGLTADCGTCHAEGWTLGEFDHSVTGLVLDEAHIEFDCEGCHTEGFAAPTTCELCHEEDYVFPEKTPGTSIGLKTLSEKL